MLFSGESVRGVSWVDPVELAVIAALGKSIMSLYMCFVSSWLYPPHRA